MSEIRWDKKKGWLVCDVSELQMDFDSLVIGGWEHKLKWWKGLRGRRLVRHSYLDRPGLPIVFISNHPAALQWRNSIPKDRLVAATNTPFPYEVLRLFASSSVAFECLEHQRLLFLCWVNHCIGQEFLLKDAVDGLRIGKRQLMGMMGFSAGKTARRLLNDFDMKVIKLWQVNAISNALRNQELLDGITHQQLLDYETLQFVCLFPQLGNSQMLSLYAQSGVKERQKIQWTLVDTERMSSILRVGVNWRGIRSCNSLSGIERLHNRLSDRMNRILVFSETAFFPAPPLEGNKHITPIQTGAELLQEGLSQKHCVASYFDSIMYGDYYVFRMDDPCRATIGIRYSVHLNRWELDQIVGKSNSEPCKEARDAAKKWLNATQFRQRIADLPIKKYRG